MGREIRRVPKEWEHPRNASGRLQPMHNETFTRVAKEWLDNALLWSKGEHPDQQDPEVKAKHEFYWEWHGDPPDREYYRPEFKSEPICFQVYENVSEGTPVSPVFDTAQEVVAWLVAQGYDPEGAKAFVDHGYAPSFVMSGGKFKSGMDAMGSK